MPLLNSIADLLPRKPSQNMANSDPEDQNHHPPQAIADLYASLAVIAEDPHFPIENFLGPLITPIHTVPHYLAVQPGGDDEDEEPNGPAGMSRPNTPVQGLFQNSNVNGSAVQFSSTSTGSGQGHPTHDATHNNNNHQNGSGGNAGNAGPDENHHGVNGTMEDSQNQDMDDAFIEVPNEEWVAPRTRQYTGNMTYGQMLASNFVQDPGAMTYGALLGLTQEQAVNGNFVQNPGSTFQGQPFAGGAVQNPGFQSAGNLYDNGSVQYHQDLPAQQMDTYGYQDPTIQYPVPQGSFYGNPNAFSNAPMLTNGFNGVPYANVHGRTINNGFDPNPYFFADNQMSITDGFNGHPNFQFVDNMQAEPAHHNPYTSQGDGSFAQWASSVAHEGTAMPSVVDDGLSLIDPMLLHGGPGNYPGYDPDEMILAHQGMAPSIQWQGDFQANVGYYQETTMAAVAEQVANFDHVDEHFESAFEDAVGTIVTSAEQTDEETNQDGNGDGVTQRETARLTDRAREESSTEDDSSDDSSDESFHMTRETRSSTEDDDEYALGEFDVEESESSGDELPEDQSSEAGAEDDEDSSEVSDDMEELSYTRARADLSTMEDLADFMTAYGEANGLTAFEVNDLVWSAANDNKEFWEEINMAIPYLDRTVLLRLCRRRFHNFPKRGTWTPKEDRELEEAVKNIGMSKWKQIGELLHRNSEDCRDRYRNYLVCKGNIRLGTWKDEEIRELKAAALKCWEDTGGLNYRVMSENMAGRRSRLQITSMMGRLTAKAKAAGLPWNLSIPATVQDDRFFWHTRRRRRVNRTNPDQSQLDPAPSLTVEEDRHLKSQAQRDARRRAVQLHVSEIAGNFDDSEHTEHAEYTDQSEYAEDLTASYSDPADLGKASEPADDSDSDSPDTADSQDSSGPPQLADPGHSADSAGPALSAHPRALANLAHRASIDHRSRAAQALQSHHAEQKRRATATPTPNRDRTSQTRSSLFVSPHPDSPSESRNHFIRERSDSADFSPNSSSDSSSHLEREHSASLSDSASRFRSDESVRQKSSRFRQHAKDAVHADQADSARHITRPKNKKHSKREISADHESSADSADQANSPRRTERALWTVSGRRGPAVSLAERINRRNTSVSTASTPHLDRAAPADRPIHRQAVSSTGTTSPVDPATMSGHDEPEPRYPIESLPLGSYLPNANNVLFKIVEQVDPQSGQKSRRWQKTALVPDNGPETRRRSEATGSAPGNGQRKRRRTARTTNAAQTGQNHSDDDDQHKRRRLASSPGTTAAAPELRPVDPMGRTDILGGYARIGVLGTPGNARSPGHISTFLADAGRQVEEVHGVVMASRGSSHGRLASASGSRDDLGGDQYPGTAPPGAEEGDGPLHRMQGAFGREIVPEWMGEGPARYAPFEQQQLLPLGNEGVRGEVPPSPQQFPNALLPAGDQTPWTVNYAPALREIFRRQSFVAPSADRPPAYLDFHMAMRNQFRRWLEDITPAIESGDFRVPNDAEGLLAGVVMTGDLEALVMMGRAQPVEWVRNAFFWWVWLAWSESLEMEVAEEGCLMS
ncbi:MAG: RNA polymerase I enhancer binding protein [Piccolia ochrophora]|nr:MAG: RNA polymerase I enhancer binding protein [Piccolia ochrophora]